MTTQVLSIAPGLGGLEASPFTYQLPEHGHVGDFANAANGSAELPAGFPTQVHNTMTWKTVDVKDSENEWIVQLTPAEASAIELAVKAFLDSKAPLPQLGPETFPLPESLKEKLDSVSETCYSGCGFCILRGLDSRERSEEERAVLFSGVSAHIASQRGFQDIDRKHVLSHLYKKYPSKENEYVPPSFNDAPVAFHTDDGDIVALYYASIMKQGGRTILASQSTVYNELAEKRPDLLQTLAEEWIIDTYHSKPGSAPRRLPLLHRHGKDITMQFSRLPFSRWEGTKPEKADVPALTAAQKEALNAIEAIAAKNAFTVPTQHGDILYFNNLGLFHGRARYVDSGTRDRLPEKMDRLVLRLWLQDPKRTSPLAPPLQKVWDGIYGPNCAAGRVETWNIEAKGTFAMNRDRNG